jgi:hypothetical protein
MKNYRKYAVASLLTLAVAGIATAENRSGPQSGGNMSQSGNADQPGQSGMMGDQQGMAGDQTKMVEIYRKIAQDPNMAADKLFVVEAAGMDAWEVAFSRLVEQRAQASR